MSIHRSPLPGDKRAPDGESVPTKPQPTSPTDRTGGLGSHKIPGTVRIPPPPPPPAPRPPPRGPRAA